MDRVINKHMVSILSKQATLIIVYKTESINSDEIATFDYMKSSLQEALKLVELICYADMLFPVVKEMLLSSKATKE